MFRFLLIAALIAVGANALWCAATDWLDSQPVYLARDLTMGVLCVAAAVAGIIEN